MPILGTSPDMIDLAEDRDRFQKLIGKLGLKQPKNGIAYSVGAGAARGRRPRLPAGGPALLRARWPGDADHPRGGAARRLPARHPAGAGAERGQGALPERQDRADQHAPRQEPAPLRPLPVRRDRGRRRRARRRQGRLHLRHHGAHRGGRHPLRRLGAARCRRTRSAPSTIAELERQTRALALRARRQGPDERPVRDQGRRHLRARGQPARLAHRALRRQGHRRALRQGRRAGDGGRSRSRSSASRRTASTTSRSRRRSSPSPASRVSTRCSGRRCARPAR